jgi:hypothetical protein
MGERTNINYNNKVVTSLWDYSNDTSLIERLMLGVVHANVGQNVTPHNPSLGLF